MFRRRKRDAELLGKVRRYVADVYVGDWPSDTQPACAPQAMMAPQATYLGTTAETSDDIFADSPETTGAFDAVTPAAFGGAVQPSLSERLDHLDESFAQTVLRLIDERGLRDATVYKRANMSRQLFAKIRRDDDYRPTKKTACALAFALRLSYEDALALLSRAGFTLSHSSKFDVIVEYCLLSNIHDINQVNMVLYEFDQQLLG